ncbi:hypothetical protein H9W95_04355 [Flavobacterium lindanitolerans]|nr:hypothetical protein [Flavobacterium lindanitolerans]
MSYASQAQISYEASTNFGKLEDLTYDATVPNKIYGRTQGNHIIVSVDNGATWSVKYSFPNPTAQLRDIKPYGQTGLSFSIINSGTQDGVYLFDRPRMPLLISTPFLTRRTMHRWFPIRFMILPEPTSSFILLIWKD